MPDNETDGKFIDCLDIFFRARIQMA